MLRLLLIFALAGIALYEGRAQVTQFSCDRWNPGIQFVAGTHSYWLTPCGGGR